MVVLTDLSRLSGFLDGMADVHSKANPCLKPLFFVEAYGAFLDDDLFPNGMHRLGLILPEKFKKLPYPPAPPAVLPERVLPRIAGN